MGNLQCGPSTVFDSEFGLDLEKDEIAREVWTCSATGIQRATERPFLKVHRADEEQRCLLDPREVSSALAEQAEELIRREMVVASRGKIKESWSDDIEEMSAESLSAVDDDSSVVAPSAFTTVSEATQAAGNVEPSHRQDSTTSRGTLLGEDDFSLNQEVSEGVRRVLLKGDMRKESFATCGIDPSCVEDDLDPEYVRLVQRHAAVLHLKMIPQCTKYFQKHLSRMLPDNPITRAVAEGITSTKLSPPRKKSRPPGITPATPDSASQYDVGFCSSCPPSFPVTLLATDTCFMDLAVTGSLGLANRENPRIVSQERKRLKSPDHYVVLVNRRSGVPLTVCALKAASTGPPVVRIFATKRRVYGQHPAATTHQLGLDWSDSLPLYTWAEIVTEGRYPGRVRYSIFMATGSDGKFEKNPRYCAVHETSETSEIRVVGRTDSEKLYAGCAVLSMCTDHDAIDEEDVFFRISLSRGIDPALLICFCAFVDESLEKAMRLQCQKAQEQVFRAPW